MTPSDTERPASGDWAAALAATVAEQVRRHRKRLGLSAQQLADRCTELGYPIARSVLANLESGRRQTVSVPDVIILGLALKVPPVALFYPAGVVEEVETYPGVAQPAIHAVQWFSGEAPPPLGVLSSVELTETEIFWVRKILEGRKQLHRKIERVAALRSLERDAPTPELRASYADAARAEMALADEGSDMVNEWIDFLSGEHPESSHIPVVKYPDQGPAAGTVDIEMVSDGVRQLRGFLAPGIPIGKGRRYSP